MPLTATPFGGRGGAGLERRSCVLARLVQRHQMRFLPSVQLANSRA